MKTTFKISKDYTNDEYQVKAYEDGKLNPKRTYFTDDLTDANDTRSAMIEEENIKNPPEPDPLIKHLENTIKRYEGVAGAQEIIGDKELKAEYEAKVDALQILIYEIKNNLIRGLPLETKHFSLNPNQDELVEAISCIRKFLEAIES